MAVRKWYTPIKRAGLCGLYVICHLVVALVIIIAIRLLQTVLKLADDPVLFDRYPIRYAFDGTEAVLLGFFMYLGVREGYRVFCEDHDG